MTHLKTIEWHTTNVFVTITILILDIASNIVCVEYHVVIYIVCVEYHVVCCK